MFLVECRERAEVVEEEETSNVEGCDMFVAVDKMSFVHVVGTGNDLIGLTEVQVLLMLPTLLMLANI